MKISPRFTALTLVAIGCGTLIVPLFTPPEPFEPTLFSFSPYVVLVCAAFLTRGRNENNLFLFASLLTTLASYLYIDPIYFGRVFSWLVVGLVQDYLPDIQLGIALPVFLIFLSRRASDRLRSHSA